MVIPAAFITPISYLVVGSFLAMIFSLKTIPKFRDMFIKAGLFGIDLNKPKKPEKKVPEAGGVITGGIYLIVIILMIPFVFSRHLFFTTNDAIQIKDSFPFVEFVQVLSAILTICSMILLGFTDDVLNLRWKYKLVMPAFASLPLLIVYYVTIDRTHIVVPSVLRALLGPNIHLGFLYYIYMCMLAIFCTNAINILSGINGLEVGQSVIIAISILTFNFKEIGGAFGDHHRFSIYFLLPYVATTLPLLYYNWYPSKVFVGDTFCYFSGMTLAVVAILGHFSKTLLLFCIPQVINFLYSAPQLFHFIPCPRHRLPKYNEETDKVDMSLMICKKKEVKTLGKLIISIARPFGLIHYREFEKDSEEYIECNNLTIINLILKFYGPMHERNLTLILLLFQIACSVFAFLVRFRLALWFYDEIIA